MKSQSISSDIPLFAFELRQSCHVAALFAVAMFQNMMFDLPSPLMPRHCYCASAVKFLIFGRGTKQSFAFINMSTCETVSDIRPFQIFTLLHSTF